MTYIVKNSIIDFKKIITMGQFFMYKELNNDVFLIQSSNKICQIEIEDNISILTSDNIEYWKHYFDLERDYNDINNYLKTFALKHNDIRSYKCILNESKIKVCNQPYLETCIEYLLSAQNNIKRIRKSMFALLDFGEIYYDDSIGIEYRSFPNIEKLLTLNETDFVNCGAGFRAKYIIEFLKNYKEIDCSLSYNEIIKFLLQYKGIGPKVANCIALYGLNQIDAFPIDVWIQKYLDKYPQNNPFIIPDKYAGILQVYIYQNIRNLKESL